jgi:hypothetical protein
MRICYECGKEIQNQKEMVLKEFRVADWGVRWVKPFHAECWQKRQKTRRKNYGKICLALLSILTCGFVVYIVLAML